jgi:GntR family transcriptional regulator
VTPANKNQTNKHRANPSRTSTRTPLGREIAEELRRRIVEGEFAPGSRLPSESDLCQQYGVSRVTVRTAAKALESQGLVDIRHGSGMFVMDFGGQIRSGVQELRSITETIAEMGLTPGVEYHRIERRRASDEERTRLHLEPEDDVLDLQRAITADGEIVAYSYDVLPATNMTPEIESSFGEGSMFTTMDRIGLVPVRALAELHAVNSTKVGWGDMRPESGLYLLLDQVHFDRSGTPVAYSKTYFVEGRFQFVILRTR